MIILIEKEVRPQSLIDQAYVRLTERCTPCAPSTNSYPQQIDDGLQGIAAGDERKGQLGWLGMT
jgi:hypothetical protein